MNKQLFVHIVWCGMSEKCLKLKVFAKIDFIAFFGFLRGQISLKYWGSIFPAPQPLNMPHNDPFKLHTIINWCLNLCFW